MGSKEERLRGFFWQVTCWEFGWDREPEDTFCWSILPGPPAPLLQDCSTCSCTGRAPSSLKAILCKESVLLLSTTPRPGNPSEVP